MIRAIAIDDELPPLQILEAFCSRLDFISLDKTFQKPTEALKYIHHFPVDLLFLDIQMPSMSGIDLFRQIQRETMVIFTTAFSEYAVDGFELNAVDFLLKPFTFDRFQRSVEKAQDFYKIRHDLQKGKDNALYIRVDYSLMRIPQEEIQLLEAYDDYVRIYLVGKRPLVTRITMKALEGMLPSSDFIRLHRSYIAPWSQIRAVRNKTITVGDKDIPLGTKFEADFWAEYRKRTGQSPNPR